VSIQSRLIAYLNGEFLPEKNANLSIFNRGFCFDEGIFEVTSVLDGKLLDSDHMTRLARSAREFDVPKEALRTRGQWSSGLLDLCLESARHTVI
jgi:D-alanine transaminase